MSRDKPIPETFGARFRAARLQAGLSQVQVAERLKTKQATISKVESDARPVSIQWQTWAASVLGWDLQAGPDLNPLRTAPPT